MLVMRVGSDEFYAHKLEKYKVDVRHEVEANSLCSYMNNAKWSKLVNGIMNLQFPPPYQLKDVLYEAYPSEFEEDVYYIGDWSYEALYPYFSIQWLSVRPRYKKKRGKYVEDEVVDETIEFIELLTDCGIKFEEVNGTYFIYGYK